MPAKPKMQYFEKGLFRSKVRADQYAERLHKKGRKVKVEPAERMDLEGKWWSLKVWAKDDLSIGSHVFNELPSPKTKSE